MNKRTDPAHPLPPPTKHMQKIEVWEQIALFRYDLLQKERKKERKFLQSLEKAGLEVQWFLGFIGRPCRRRRRRRRRRPDGRSRGRMKLLLFSPDEVEDDDDAIDALVVGREWSFLGLRCLSPLYSHS